MTHSLSESTENFEINGALGDILGPLDTRNLIFRFEARGTRYEPLQAQRPEGPSLRPSEFEVFICHDLSLDRMRLSWKRSILEPLSDSLVFDEILVGNKGYISGADVALHPQGSRPMTPDRLAAVRRQQYLLNPQLLVGDALRRQRDSRQQIIHDLGYQEVDGTVHHVVEIEAFPRPVRLFVVHNSNQLSHLVTQENDYPCGDVEISVKFHDWQFHESFAVPYRVELSWDGRMLHSESRQRFELNPQITTDIFDIPETLPFIQEEAESGLMNAQWIHRALAMGAPISLDAGAVVPEEITPDVVTMGGGIHHSLAIALDSGVVVVDPPQHEERSLEVIKAVATRWPEKRITHLILTHHHHDHSGGIRAYAAIGAELIVAAGDLNFVSQCLTRPHTIRPDTLAATEVRPSIQTVGSKGLKLGEGAIEIHRISSPHCAENLVVYVTEPKLLFNADLFNPGLVPSGAAAPPHWLIFSRDFLRELQRLNLDIKYLVGAHGAPEGRPFQSLVDFTL